MSAPAPNMSKKPPVPCGHAVVPEERREATRSRDEARYRLAEERAAVARLSIPRDAGFAIYPPGEVERADQVVSAGNALIDSIGTPPSRSRLRRAHSWRSYLIPGSTYAGVAVPWFALGSDIGHAAAAYLGFVPFSTKVDLLYSIKGPREAPTSSQLWHLDQADTSQVKVAVHLNDIVREMGPMTAIDAAATELVADRVGYDLDDRYGVSEDDVLETAGAEGLVRFEARRAPSS